MTSSRLDPAAELASIRRAYRTISTCVWLIAAAVMIYGVSIVFSLLVDHGIPGETAWLLPLIVDASLVVGLVATPLLARHRIRSRWVGTLRWIAGSTTWWLQTAESWFKAGGPDWMGVAIHSAGPLLLFFVVEAASYFQRKMSATIAGLEAEVRQDEARRRAEAAEMDSLRKRIAEMVRERGDVDAVRLTVQEQAATIEALEAAVEAADRRRVEDLTALTERLTTDHNETVRALNDKHKVALQRARAEGSTVNLNEYRRSHNGAPATKPAKRVRISDEEAVQRMLAVSRDPGYDWSQNAVRELTGVGFERAKDLIAAWRNAATPDHNDTAVERTG
jgi:hypothetical protein